MNGPTLNAAYNNCLANWARAGHPAEPRCESCECDLTGRNVHECGAWVCSDCEREALTDAYQLDRWHERRQMGLVD